VTTTSQTSERSGSVFAEPAGSALSLLLLGQAADPRSERGVECPGDLPAPSDPDLVARTIMAVTGVAA